MRRDHQLHNHIAALGAGQDAFARVSFVPGANGRTEMLQALEMNFLVFGKRKICACEGHRIR